MPRQCRCFPLLCVILMQPFSEETRSLGSPFFRLFSSIFLVSWHRHTLSAFPAMRQLVFAIDQWCRCLSSIRYSGDITHLSRGKYTCYLRRSSDLEHPSRCRSRKHFGFPNMIPLFIVSQCNAHPAMVFWQRSISYQQSSEVIYSSREHLEVYRLRG